MRSHSQPMRSHESDQRHGNFMRSHNAPHAFAQTISCERTSQTSRMSFSCDRMLRRRDRTRSDFGQPCARTVHLCARMKS
ncbi:unnamed protein product [Rhodiola kirilowii]